MGSYWAMREQDTVQKYFHPIENQYYFKNLTDIQLKDKRVITLMNSQYSFAFSERLM